MEYGKCNRYKFYVLWMFIIISLPDISKWNIKNIDNLNNLFENCSRLNFLPDISKWNLNHKIKINNIFRGCNSLLIIPDVSKWNINFSEISDFSSSSYISNKNYESSLKSEEFIDYSDLSQYSSSFKTNNDIILFEKNNLNDISKNEELEDYYDNFYN